MLDSIQYLVAALKEARKKNGLSQRALSIKIDVPQSHISKIESGSVDLQTTTLVELSRILDLELMLVPRALIPAVKALKRGILFNEDDSTQLPAYRLDEEDEEDHE